MRIKIPQNNLPLCQSKCNNVLLQSNILCNEKLLLNIFKFKLFLLNVVSYIYIYNSDILFSYLNKNEQRIRVLNEYYNNMCFCMSMGERH